MDELKPERMAAIRSLSVGLAHELNNCLTPITLQAQLLLERPGLATDVRVQLESILNAARRGRELVAGVLGASRALTNVKPHVFAPQPVMDEALQRIAAMSSPGIELKGEVDPECPCLLGDPGALVQVIVNLGLNSLQAMQERGGKLLVSLRPLRAEEAAGLSGAERWVLLTVADTGHGMSAQVMDRIFEPYFTTGTLGVRAGLGLPIVQELVQQMRGQIRLHSSPESGTQVRVIVPAAAPLALSDTRAG